MLARCICVSLQSLKATLCLQLSESANNSPQKVAEKQVATPLSPGGNSVESSPRIAAHNRGNNYHRSEGQNVGNFLTDRNSSRVMAPPGGRSNITFG